MEQSDRVNILLVDDQPAKLISYEVMLAELRENLIKASSAREALAHLLKNEIAVVLVDVCMPELDGFELAAMIREHPRFRQTAIIFISAIHLADVDRLRGYQMGAVDYMPVPVIPEILRAKVKVFVELYRKTRQLEQWNLDLERRVTDRTAELEASNAMLIESESRRSIALAAGKMGSWDWDLVQKTHHWDAEHYRIVGVDPESFEISAESVRALVHPEDWEKLETVLSEVREGRRSFQMELRFVRPDGDCRWCAVTAAASFDSDGQLIRMSGVTADITDRKRAEDYHDLLAREVDHRAKNALAIVQSIVRLTRASSVQDFARAVEGRIAAVSHAHTLLSESRWEGAELQHLVRDELAPYERTNEKQLSIKGPNVTLEPSKAQSLALILHELATNSAKYGALSSPSGMLSVAWGPAAGGLRLTWKETGSPHTMAPEKKGFGLNVITTTVEGQLRGTVKFEWHETGLCCEVLIPSKAVFGAQVEDFMFPADSRPPAPTRMSVLLVEDEPLVAMMMQNTLAQMGIDTVGPYGQVKEALAAAQANSFSAGVLDVNLGGETVYEVAELLTRIGTPFIFVSGYGKEGIDPRFENIPVLRKPVDFDDLRRALRDATLKRGTEFAVALADQAVASLGSQ
jgi:PAS domain S-box-containing protein